MVPLLSAPMSVLYSVNINNKSRFRLKISVQVETENLYADVL